MKRFIRYLPIATVLLLPFLSPFPGSKAQRDENTQDERAFKPTSPLSQDQKTVDGSPVKGKFYGNLDIRLTEPAAAAKLAQMSSSAVAQKARKHALGMEKAVLRLRSDIPGVDARVSPITGAVEVLRSNTGALSDFAQGRSGADIARSFIRDNSGVYGLGLTDIANLHFIGESVSPGSGLRMVRVEQTVNGLPVFQSETRFILDAGGRVFRSTGLMIPNATAIAPPLNLGQLLSAQEALGHAMASVDISVGASQESLITTDGEPTRTEVIANNPDILGNVPSKLVYFPIAPGVLIPAWSQITFTDGTGDWYTLVDANTGKLLWRKNIRDNASTHEARFSVYVQADGKTPADSPAPRSPTTAVTGGGTQFPEILRTTVNMLTVQDILASPNGWINDCPGGICTAAETQTIGNNVHAYLDRVAAFDVPDTAASSVLDGNGKPTGNPDTFVRNRDFLGGAPRNFNYTPPPQLGNPEAGQTATGNGNNGTLAVDFLRRGAITQLFYVTNWYHDRLFALGFDEAAGNFQQTNFSGMGVGNDRVLAEDQDGATTPEGVNVNTSNFSTPPDGVSGRAQMYRFTGPTIDRDGALDSEILIHELTHGTSNRLIGNGAGLVWDVGRGMGEGWSDFYALALLNNTNADDPNGKYANAAYTTYKLGAFLDNYVYGNRRFPYSTDNTVNPLTWADVDDVTNNLSGGIAPDPRGLNSGGAFAVHNIGEVWALTLWEVRSRIIAANAGDVPTGNQKTLQIVTDAMKMTPTNPTFIEARDALIDADCAANACANEASIWAGFADRGLGHKASAPLAQMDGYLAGHMGIKESFLIPDLDVQSVTVSDSSGNNNGAIDPGEPISITVSLNNPWSSASKNVASATATLATSTAGVTIYDGNSTYPAIASQASAAGDTFFFTVPTSATCGQSLKFTLTPNSTLGTTNAREIVLRVGAAAGTGTPVTYTRTVSPILAIPDVAPRGVVDAMTITDDLEIADINFRVDNITHTFTGDLSVMLRAPSGYGTDLISFIGATTDGGPGANLINTVVDDTAAAPNDFLTTTAAQAPFTDDFIPIFNSPVWATFFVKPHDPVGELGRLNGTSTQGTWNVLVSDQQVTAIGTLNAWSLIVTPRAFACVAFTPVSNVLGTKTVSGTFTPGGSVTYTVTLTNNGSAAQADNAGDEFTDMLPPQLTLVNASATSGTAGANTGTNTVTWNGSLAPFGGSVTITINATINSVPDGTTVSNQGTISYDGDGNGTNEASRMTDDPSVGGASDPTNFTVSDVNDPPDAVNDALSSVVEDSGVRTIPIASLLANDNAGPANESGQTLTFSLEAGSEVGGTVSSDATNVYFTPAANHNGPASFQYRITDNGTSNGAPDPKSDTATVSFTVTEVNDLPDAVNDALSSVAEDSGVRTIPIASLLANDTKGPADESGQTLSFSLVGSSEVGGTVSSDATNVYFTPSADYNGPASFQYTVTDNGTTNGLPDPKSDTATVSFTVTEVNDPPDAVNDALSSVAEDSGVRTIAIASLLANDLKGAGGPADESGQTLSFSLVGSSEVGGTVSSDATNVYFTPSADYNGPASFQYTVTDNGTTNGLPDPKSDTATVSFTITEVNDAPTAVSETIPNVAEDSGQRTIPFATLTGNDSKGPANESGQTLIVKTVSNPVGGTVSILGGNVLFTLTANYNGPASFDYTVEDNGTTNGVAAPLTSGTATASFTITEVNDVPIAFNDPLGTVAENSGERIIQFSTLLSNDLKGPANESGQTLIVKTVFNAVGGTVSIVAGTVRFNLTANFHGQASFQYTIEDNGTTNGVPDPKTSAPATAFFNVTSQPDPGGVIKFSAANYSVAEGAGSRTITVERTGDTTQAVTVDYASSDHGYPADFVPCTAPGAGLASSRCDFTTALGTLRFAAGETSKTFNVLIGQDNYVEGTETLELTLSNPTEGAALGVPATAILEITDDATEGATNPIDISSEFVRSLYHDLLNREPDPPGLAFWIDNIEKCNDPARRPAGQTVAQCIDKQRESTAIAFFMSPELQMTGGFVYRLYKGSLTGTPNYDGATSGLGGRFPTFVEFMFDVSQVSEGIVVNNQIDGAVVEANRNRLAEEFVLRPEFVTKYGGLDNTLFVQELFNTTGIAATAGEKQALVDGLTNMTETRASVLRKVVDGTVVISEGNVQFTTTYGQAFYNQEFRRLFVYMEYVGFLRRNPDTAGFIHWLGKLNQFNGDPFQAEMVRAFILSPEYRSRFGQP